MPITSRFAPSPTGYLHLGHAYSALVAHDCARLRGGRFLIRIDDLDCGRVRNIYRDAITDDLRWLGLVPDAPPMLQSMRSSHYAAALHRLRSDGFAYPCFCTRSAIAAEIVRSVDAPHDPVGALYPGTCRSLGPEEAEARIAGGAGHAWRLNTTAASTQVGVLSWYDQHRGKVVARPCLSGDIALVRRDGTPSYHLASTVDDAWMRTSHVARGDDLFTATHIHRLLQALLGLPTPAYVHHRLVADGEGQRIAKRDGATSIGNLRDAGVNPVTLINGLRNGLLPFGYRWTSVNIRD